MQMQMYSPKIDFESKSHQDKLRLLETLVPDEMERLQMDSDRFLDNYHQIKEKEYWRLLGCKSLDDYCESYIKVSRYKIEEIKNAFDCTKSDQTMIDDTTSQKEKNHRKCLFSDPEIAAEQILEQFDEAYMNKFIDSLGIKLSNDPYEAGEQVFNDFDDKYIYRLRKLLIEKLSKRRESQSSENTSSELPLDSTEEVNPEQLSFTEETATEEAKIDQSEDKSQKTDEEGLAEITRSLPTIMSYPKLAKSYGVDRNTLENWYLGKRNPRGQNKKIWNEIKENWELWEDGWHKKPTN